MEYMGPGRTPGEKTAHGLHVQDRSQIAASPPFALIPSSVSAERELGKEIRLEGLYFLRRGKSLLSITCEPNRSGCRDPSNWIGFKT